MSASGAALPRSFLRLALLFAASLVVARAAATTPLIPRGAWSLTFDTTCADAAVGKVAAAGELELRADGSEGAVVTCDVKTAGEGFAVSGRVEHAGQSLVVEVGELRKDATLEAPSTGGIALRTQDAGEVYASDECVFYFVEEQLVDEGKVWVSFQCPEISTSDGTCAVEQGNLALENCIRRDDDGGC